MSDSIILSRLAVYARHGLYDQEKELGQRFFISLTCSLDLRPAGESDDYRQSVCYATLAELVHECATTHRFRLIEGLAEFIASRVLNRFPRLAAVTVRIEKPEAPIPLVFDTVAVEIRRSRDA